MVERLRILKILFLLTATNKQILNVQFQWVLATVYTVTTEQYSIENISVDERVDVLHPPWHIHCSLKKKIWPHSEACGPLVSQLGIEPSLSALEGRVLITGPPGKSQHREHFCHQRKFPTFLGIPLSVNYWSHILTLRPTMSSHFVPRAKKLLNSKLY